MIGRRFQHCCQHLGLNTTRLKLNTERFKRPAKAGEQLALL
jgi:hypothetical protein